MADPQIKQLHRPVWLGWRTLRATAAKYREPDDLRKLHAAYRFARNNHAGQKRRSGEPYMTHPLAVAQILAEMEMDLATLMAGLLHDVVEDTGVTQDDAAQRFGPEVAALVDGVTKLTIVTVDDFRGRSTDDPQTPQDKVRAQRKEETVKNAANLRKIFMAMAKDLRVMVVKLADRLHNMRTLDSMPEEKRMRIAEETLHVFAPLAHRLGIWQMKWELEDLAFKYVEPVAYDEVAKQVAQTRGQRQSEVDEAVSILKERLVAEGIGEANVHGRPKHLWSIYQKMLKQELDFKELFDLVALRIVVHTKPQCYHALGIVSGLWKPVPGMFSDYIAHSKSNMYQSLHLKIVGPQGKPIEVQIRTWEMHRTAEFGVAAHWAYKDKGEGGKATDQFERKLNWLRQQIFELQAEAREPGEFLRSVTEDLFVDQVFVFTPKGDVFDLPAGATPVDFAFRIHSDVGSHAVGAKVNGKLVPLSYQFRNGDVTDIITRSDGHPSRDWLAYTKTSHARSKIKAYFKRLSHAENVVLGREAIQREADRLGLDARTFLKEEALKAIAPSFNVANDQDLLAAVGYGTVSPTSVINRIQPGQSLAPKGLVVGRGRADDSKLKVTAGSVDNVMFRRSRCCLPIPGDDVIGYVTRGKGMALHRRDCPNVKHYEKTEAERLIAVDYGGGDTQVYSINLIIETADRTGLLADIGTVFGEQKTFITAIKTQSHRDRTATLEVAAEVKDVDHLNRLFQAVTRLPDVLNISRALGGREK